MILTYSTVRYGEIDVCWTPELEGGGMSFGQDYLPVVANLFGHVGRVFEFCAGPGFIGFSLLAHGLCDSLALIDVNPAAVAAARETVRRNGLEDRVTVYLSDGLDGLPADERCDESGTKWGRQRSPGRAMFAVVGSWLASASSGPR